MRTRTIDSRTALTYQDVAERYDCTGPVLSVQQQAGYVGRFRSFSDVVTPSFRRRSASGELIINPMRLVEQTVSVSGDGPGFNSTSLSCAAPAHFGYWHFDGPSMMPAWGLNNLSYVSPRVISAEETTSVVNQAVTSCWNEMRSASASLPVDIAELRKTLEMLRRPFKSVRDYASQVERKYSRKFRRRPKSLREAMEGTWMETRYGWRPLIHSVFDVMKALDSLQHKFDRRTVRSKSEFNRNGVVATGSALQGSGYVDWQCYATEVISVRAGAVIEEGLTLAKALGFDLGGILTLPWELTTASFVADWFVNVSDYLGGLGAYLTISPKASWYVQENRITCVYSCISTIPLAGIRSVARDATCIATVQRVERTRIPGLGAPQLAVDPRFAQLRSWAHAVDAAILITQRFR